MDHHSILTALLSQTPNLQSLTFESSDWAHEIPWQRYNARNSTNFTETSSCSLPIVFERLTHLELRTSSIRSLAALLRHAPNLSSLALLVHDGLFEHEMVHVLEHLTGLSKLKRLSFGVAEWGAVHGSTRVGEMMKRTVAAMIKLEELDLRTPSYDVIDGGLQYRPVPQSNLDVSKFTFNLRLFFRRHENLITYFVPFFSP